MTLTPGQKKIAVCVGILLALVAVWWFFIRKPKPKAGAAVDEGAKKAKAEALKKINDELAECNKKLANVKLDTTKPHPCAEISARLKKEEESGYRNCGGPGQPECTRKTY